MSDYFTMLVDRDVSLNDATAALRDVLSELQRLNIIAITPTNDCVLDGEGYPPGTAISECYTVQSNEHPFWQLQTCGVETAAKRQFNYYAYGPAFDGVACPICRTFFTDSPDEFSDAIGEWLKQTGPGLVVCPKCNRGSVIETWDAKNPLGFGNLSLTFWNWPPFNGRGWNIDIPKLIEQITGHTIIQSYGRL